MRALIPTLFLLVAVNATAVLAQEARVIVTVVDDFAVPIPDVRIQISLEDRKTVVATALTDALGVAVIPVRPFRSYSLRATREGFTSVERGLEFWPPSGEVGIPIQLRFNEVPPPVDFVHTGSPSPPKGLVSGRILSAAGEVVGDIAVDVRSDDYQFSRTRTEPDGSYRLALRPGTYIINAGGDLGVPPSLWSSSTLVAYDRNDDVRATVVAGHETRAAEIVLTPVHLFNVTVIVQDEEGKVIPGAEVHFTGRREGRVSGSFMGDRKTGSDGSLKLGPLSPGSVDVFASARDGARDLAAFTSIEIQNSPLTLTLQLRRAARLTGRVEFVERLNPLHGKDGLRVGHMGLDSMPPRQRTPNPAGLVGPTGEFTLTNLIGERCLLLFEIPFGWHLRDITHNGEDYTNRPFSFGPGDEVSEVLILVERGDASSAPSRRCGAAP